jgi:hypothetical protein
MPGAGVRLGPPRRRAAAAAAPALCALLCALRGGSAAAAFTCRADQDATTCAALGALYASAGGASWVVRAGWSDAAAGRAADYCAFTGVTCAADGNASAMCVGANERTSCVQPLARRAPTA